MSDRSSRTAGVLAATVIVVVAGGTALWFANRTLVPETLSRPEMATPAPKPSAVDTAAPSALPKLDLVRVEPDGQAAVAGTAMPGAMVTIFADKAPVAEAQADADGNFVAIFAVEPSAEPRALTLGVEAPDGTETTSNDVVMLLPNAPGAETPPGAAPAPTVAATAIVREDGVDILPPAGDPAALRRVTLGSISYAGTGEVRLAGVGTAGSVIRIYVNDGFAREVRVAGDGRWRSGLEDLTEGLYRLRIDQLGPDGAVASRVETPFRRDMPPPPRPRPDGSAGTIVTAGPDGETQLTVQPGNNLWTLAQTHYGSGVEYTRIFTANRDLIRDPDLIYPGQIFRVPDEGNGAAAVAR